MPMEKTKVPPRDYDADLRFAPPPENATRKELIERARRVVKAVVSGGAPRREPKDPKVPGTART